MKSYPLQQILYGAPGTGKSHFIEEIIQSEPHIRTTFHPDSDYSSFVGTYKPTMSRDKTKHRLNLSTEELAEKLKQCYSNTALGKTGGLQKFCIEYHDYFEDDKVGYKDVLKIAGLSERYGTEIYKYFKFLELMEETENKIVYRFVPQAFLKAYCAAWKQMPKPFFLVIEEINRGNCAQIFGDIFQLLDRKTDGFSKYGIVADDDIQQFLCCDKVVGFGSLDPMQKERIPKKVWQGTELILPPNLHIWATMNTSDQSLFPIDSAFKRRWDWKYMKIANGYKKDKMGEFILDGEGKKVPLDWKIDIKIKDGQEVSWWNFLKKINIIIASMTSRADKQLGYFFCKADKKLNDIDETETVISIDSFVGKVLFYLWNDVFRDYGFEDSSLFRYKSKEPDEETESEKELSFPDFYSEDGDHVNKKRVSDFVEKVMAWKRSNETID